MARRWNAGRLRRLIAMALGGGIVGGTSTNYILEEFVYAPVRHPELLPSLLPLIVGAVVIELYFGKYKSESLGWNTAVGNAIIWTTTGATLLLTSNLDGMEKQAAYLLIGVGAAVGYMDFFHKWPDWVAFLVSSSGIVYSLAYVIVVMIKTGIPLTNNAIKAAAIFFVGVNVVFRFIKAFETPRDRGMNQFG